MAAINVNGVAMVDVTDAGDIKLTIVDCYGDQDELTVLLSTSTGLKLADTLSKAAKVAEAAYAAQVRQRKLELEIEKLQAKLAEKLAALS